jgi:hypothetical protein
MIHREILPNDHEAGWDAAPKKHQLPSEAAPLTAEVVLGLRCRVPPRGHQLALITRGHKPPAVPITRT